jgi:hypothetical protein
MRKGRNRDGTKVIYENNKVLVLPQAAMAQSGKRKRFIGDMG